MPRASAVARAAKPCAPSVARIAADVRSNIAREAGTSANAVNSAAGVEAAGEPGGPLPREQPRQELGPVGRQLDQRLVHQVLVEVAAPDVR